MTHAPIFIVGCPRSGTTLLRNLLRSHPNLTFPRESQFIPRFYRAYGDPRDVGEAIALARRVLGLSWIQRWGLDLSPEQFAGCRSFREFVSDLFAAWARRDGKPRWGDKTPQYVTEIPTLLRLFPEGQVIHIYRDGRDVAPSWLRARFEPGNLYTAATLWRQFVRQGREAGAGLGDETYHEVQYERLVGDARGTMQAVCDFLDEPFCDDVLTPSPLPQAPRMRALTVSTTRIVPTNVEKWRTQLSPRDRVLFTSVAGDLLDELGYEVSDPARWVSPPERLAWRGHHAVVSLGRRVRMAIDPEFAKTSWEFLRARLRGAASLKGQRDRRRRRTVAAGAQRGGRPRVGRLL